MRVDLLWPSDTILWLKSWLALTQVMACCSMAPSHSCKRSLLIISEVCSDSHLRAISQELLQLPINKISSKITHLKFKSPWGPWVNVWYLEQIPWSYVQMDATVKNIAYFNTDSTWFWIKLTQVHLPHWRFYLPLAIRLWDMSNFCVAHYVDPFLQVMLRRMVYLGIKEMSNIAEDVIIVTSR